MRWWGLYFALGIASSRSVAGDSINCTTGPCHSEVLTGAFIHGPVKGRECVICHEGSDARTMKLKGKSHPFVKKLSAQETIATCTSCHDNLQHMLSSGLRIHKPISEHGCLACHEPHHADNKHLLKKSKNATQCLDCHNKDVSHMTHHHDMDTTQQCGRCHEPHGSTQAFLLRNSSQKVCFECHAATQKARDGHIISNIQEEIARGKFVHEPVSKKGCLACHGVHGTENFKGQYERNTHGNYDTGSFESCFKCHDKKLLSSDSRVTKFRNGQVNLHALHVLGGRAGRSCNVCHMAHAGHLPHLLRPFFRYEGFELPIHFKDQPSGGSCSAACHGVKAYSRDTEITNPKGR